MRRRFTSPLTRVLVTLIVLGHAGACKGPRVGPPLDTSDDDGNVVSDGLEAGVDRTRPTSSESGTGNVRADASTETVREEPSVTDAPDANSEPASEIDARTDEVDSDPQAAEPALGMTDVAETDVLPGDTPGDTEPDTDVPPGDTSSDTNTGEQSDPPEGDDLVHDDLQEAIDAADDGAVIEIDGGLLEENVIIENRRLTLRCSADGNATRWRCADRRRPAITAGPGSDISLERCVIENCDGGVSDAFNAGAILIIEPRRLSVTECVFRNNTAHRGPVASTFQKDVGNLVDAEGLLHFEDNIMLDNHADDAGAIYIRGATRVNLTNNLVYANLADDYGAAIWLREQLGSQTTFVRNTLVGNVAARGPALDYYDGQGQPPSLESSIVAENLPYDTAPAWLPSYSLVDQPSPLVAPDAGDFSLDASSAAIDGGNPTLIDEDGSRADQGADLARLPFELLE